MPVRLWTLGAKVRDAQAEVEFIEAIGGHAILRDDAVEVGGRVYQIPLVRWGDTRMHLAEEMVYEDGLADELGYGLAHVVFEVDDLSEMREKALAAGASEISPVARVEAGFGIRDVAFFQSPGGTLFEFIHIVEDRVGDV